MKRNFALILAALLTGLLVYGVLFRTATREPHTLLQSSDGEMEWLRREFKLDAAQFGRIKVLHDNYDPVCMQLCARVSEANARLQQAVQGNPTFSAEVTDALHGSVAVQEECRTAMLGHLYAVSREMNPDQGARYLQMMLPHVIQPPIRNQSHCH